MQRKEEGGRSQNNYGNFGGRNFGNGRGDMNMGGHDNGRGYGNRMGELTCYRCGDVGHIAEECDSQKQCYICLRDDHLLAECQAKKGYLPVAKLCGFAGTNLGFFSVNVADEDRKVMDLKHSVVVKVKAGNLSLNQLVMLLGQSWGMDMRGKVDQIDEKVFVVHCKDESKLADLTRYKAVEIGGVTIAADYWDNGVGAVGRLRQVWVKVRGIPLHLVRWYVLAQIISSIGKIKDIDLRASRMARFAYTRLLVACLSPENIPQTVRVEVDDWIYEVSFEVEANQSTQTGGDDNGRKPEKGGMDDEEEDSESGHFKRQKKDGKEQGQSGSGQSKIGVAMNSGNTGGNGYQKQNVNGFAESQMFVNEWNATPSMFHKSGHIKITTPRSRSIEELELEQAIQESREMYLKTKETERVSALKRLSFATPYWDAGQSSSGVHRQFEGTSDTNNRFHMLVPYGEDEDVEPEMIYEKQEPKIDFRSFSQIKRDNMQRAGVADTDKAEGGGVGEKEEDFATKMKEMGAINSEDLKFVNEIEVMEDAESKILTQNSMVQGEEHDEQGVKEGDNDENEPTKYRNEFEENLAELGSEERVDLSYSTSEEMQESQSSEIDNSQHDQGGEKARDSEINGQQKQQGKGVKGRIVIVEPTRRSNRLDNSRKVQDMAEGLLKEKNLERKKGSVMDISHGNGSRQKGLQEGSCVV